MASKVKKPQLPNHAKCHVRTGDKVVDSCLDNHTGSGVTCSPATDLNVLITNEKKAQQQQQKK